MVKAKKVIKEEVVKQERSIEDVMAENAKLRESVESLSAAQPVEEGLSRYMNEIKSINKKARVESDKVMIQEFSDHKNISLWTKLGKRIGPLHRDNAIRTLNRFFDLGIILSTTQPTSVEIEAYKLTSEYKVTKDKLDKSRALKDKSKKAGQMDKLAKAIAEMAGTNVEAINHILKAHEIKPLTAGRE